MRLHEFELVYSSFSLPITGDSGAVTVIEETSNKTTGQGGAFITLREAGTSQGGYNVYMTDQAAGGSTLTLSMAVSSPGSENYGTVDGHYFMISAILRT